MKSPAQIAVDRCLKNIVDTVIKAEINNYGLFDGKAGLAIFLYKYAQLYKDNNVRELADVFLNDICNDIGNIEAIDFANGLTGIGWMLEYLSQNNLVAINTNPLLNNWDHSLFLIPSQRLGVLDLNSQLFGNGLYYLKRLNDNSGPNDPNHLFNRQIALFLLDECEKLLVNKQFLNDKIATISLKKISSIIFFLIEVSERRYNPAKSLYLLEISLSYLKKSLNIYHSSIDLFLLEKLLERIAVVFQNHQKIWEGNNILYELKANLTLDEVNLLSDCCDINLYNLIFTISLPTSFRRSSMIKLIEFFNRNKIQEISARYLGLKNGYSGIGMFLISAIEDKIL